MTRDEAILLIAQVRAGWPWVSIVAGMDEAWHRALEDLDYEDCSMAIVEWSKANAERSPQPANVRNLLRSQRETTAQKETARRAIDRGPGRHRMDRESFMATFEQARAENAGRYKQMHDARRAREKAEGQVLNAYQPMPGLASHFGGSPERSPQDRQAGPDA